MTLLPTQNEFLKIREGYSPNPSASLSLRSEAYTDLGKARASASGQLRVLDGGLTAQVQQTRL